MEHKIKFTSIDEYHASFLKDVQLLLEEMRGIIKKAVPKATETISYNMPAFKQHSVLVYYAANKNHIGFYPTSQPIIAFEQQLKNYKTSKGAIQFPMDKPLPKKLIMDIVKFRMKADEETYQVKKKK